MLLPLMAGASDNLEPVYSDEFREPVAAEYSEVIEITAPEHNCTGADCAKLPPIEIARDMTWFEVDPTVNRTISTDPFVRAMQTNGSLSYLDAALGKMQRRVDNLCANGICEIEPVAPVRLNVDNSYNIRKYDKTVDWKTGVPLWDDSVAHYIDKNFEPSFDTITYELADAPSAETAVIVEELLVPRKPTGNLWLNTKYVAQDMGCATSAAFGTGKCAKSSAKPNMDLAFKKELIKKDDGCPFKTLNECDIWRTKPMVREVVAPRSNALRPAAMQTFIDATRENPDIIATDAAAKPMLSRYHALVQSARSCCTEGIKYSLKRAGATDDLIYKFLIDDANFYGLGSRCLMMSDADMQMNFPGNATANVAAGVRDGCLCRGRQWFSAMLAPFITAYAENPEFATAPFEYTYIDGLDRETTVSVNYDVQNVLDILETCP